MGADPGLVKEMRLLNRLVAWTPRGTMREAAPRHGEIVIRELGLDDDGVSSAVTPGERITVKPKVASENDGTYLCAECDHVHAFGEWPAELSSMSGCDHGSSAKQDLDDKLPSSKETSSQSSVSGIHGLKDSENVWWLHILDGDRLVRMLGVGES